MRTYLFIFLMMFIFVILSALEIDKANSTCPTPINIKYEYQEEGVKISWTRNIGQKLYIIEFYTDETDIPTIRTTGANSTIFPYCITKGNVYFKIKAVCKNGCNSYFTKEFRIKIS